MPADLVTLALIGVASGVLAGIFGIGGGIIIIPALVYLLGYSQHQATGTTLAVLLPPVGIAAFLEYYRHNNVNLRAAVVIAIGLVLGAWAGAYLANRMSGPALRLAFGIFITAMGFALVYGALRRLGWM
ncbi:MAG TPA: sulfite exporter TauE/SafE family protein [Deltaproteobacteria bacterium]|nr:sulfite exporter TauE/SafE family protein [Deltaproteobacteria bacterium]